MKRFLIYLLLFLSLILLYAFYIEPNNLKINEYIIKNSKINNNYNGLKIVHFSDTLYTNKINEENIKLLINTINDVDPDIIVFTGDLINKKVNNENKDLITKYLNKLKCKLYKYAILGEHDNNVTSEIFNNTNFIQIDNSYQYIFIDDNTPIEISNGNFTYEENITSSYKISLIHKPDEADKISENYDLILAGHSLGGQVRIPFYGPIYNLNGSKKYTSNYHEFNNSIMYISYGIGNIKYNIRLFDKPSINIYRLESK